MEKLITEKVESAKEILQILKSFKNCFDSLRFGEIDIKIMAQKFADYGVVLKTCSKDKNVSFASFYCNDVKTRQAYLSLIAVSPEYRRKGYGNNMLKQVILYSKNEGMTSIKLEVRKDNLSAVRFYKKVGFKITESKNEKAYFMLYEI